MFSQYITAMRTTANAPADEPTDEALNAFIEAQQQQAAADGGN